MPDFCGRLQAALDGYAKFLTDKDLAPPKQQPYLVRWVREFLVFAREHAGYTFVQTLDLFLAEVGGRVGIDPRRFSRQRTRCAPTAVNAELLAASAWAPRRCPEV